MSTSHSSGSSNGQQGASQHYRHDRSTVAKLEDIFKECTHPDETRFRQIGEELGLDPQQVKIWFQNKKTQIRNISERLDSRALRIENHRMQLENNTMKETLKNLPCRICGVQSLSIEPVERQLSLHILKANNILLNQECERVESLLKKSGINPELLTTFPPSSSNDNNHIPIDDHQHNFDVLTHHHIQTQDIETPTQDIHTLTQDIHTLTIDENIPVFDDPALNYDQEDSPLISSFDHNVAALVTALDQIIPPVVAPHDQHKSIPSIDKEIQWPNNPNKNVTTINDMMSLSRNMDRVRMLKIAEDAVEELLKLLRLNEPFWFRSLLDGKFVLQRHCYKRIFGKNNCLNGPHARRESSKDLRVVKMSGAQLVDIFLNSDKWADLFPTIVKKARTIQVFESGTPGNRNGVLQLMNVEMHILSHLVPIRKFHLLRYCKEIEVGLWVIGDVSFDSSSDETTLSYARKLPSGCLIQEMTEGMCSVTWVEHVEVDDKMQIHQLFRDVICDNNAFGAERWIMTLERMCQRFASASAETIPSCDFGGVIRSCEERKRIMHLSHRMVKTFCGNLDMTSDTNFRHLTRMNDGGIKVSIRVNYAESDIPKGTIISASTCFRVPISPQKIFNYLIDNKERAKWDILWNGREGHEIQRISTGSNPGNCISIFRPFLPKEKNPVILQESYEDSLGSMLVFTPFDMELLNFVMNGEDTSLFPILPSGLTISWDGQPDVAEEQDAEVGKSRGSLVTLMFQLLASSPSTMNDLDIRLVVDSANTVVTSTVESIKTAFNCSNLK